MDCLLKRLHHSQYFADECTDISTIGRTFCSCLLGGEDGLPVENFTEMIQLKKADDNTICETIID